jgi:hypothetical protein
MMWINICFSVVGFGALAALWFWWRISRRGPAFNIEPEHHAPGYRAWEQESHIPHPNYIAIMRLLLTVAIILMVIAGVLGYQIAKTQEQSMNNDIVLLPVDDLEIDTFKDEVILEDVMTITTTDEQTMVVVSTVDSVDLLSLGTATHYPTYTPFPTYTPYPTLTPYLLIVTPVDGDNRPTQTLEYIPQAQQSSYGRVVPDQRGQQQVYQQPPAQYYQQPQYVYPTAQYIIPRWEDYITPTLILTNTPAPTQTPYMVVVTSPPIVITNTPMPTATETPTDVPSQTPYIIVVTNTPMPTATDIPTETPTPTATATFEPSPTPIPPTATPEPTATEGMTDEPTDDH